MGTEHLNDSLGQEASDAIDRDKELERAIIAMLGGSAVGGYYGQEPQKKKPKRKDNGKRSTDTG